MLKYFMPFAIAAAIASPALAGEDVDYSADGLELQGYFAKAENPAGTVLIIHDWDGLTQYEKDRADMLAEMGYDAFALDLFGKNDRPQNMQENQAATGKLYSDRPLMRALLMAGLNKANELGSDGVVVAGYCFGGAAALELARSGMGEPAGVTGYTTFHGGLGTPEGQSYSADTAPIFIAHGGADQAVPMSEVVALSEQLEQAGVTYEIQVYSGAPHAFTVIGSDRYRERADMESWDAFGDFLGTHLGG